MALVMDDTAVKRLETKWFKEKVYVALEDVNMDWTQAEIVKFRMMWNSGVHPARMAEILKREQIEILILVMDQEIKGEITERMGGFFGGYPAETDGDTGPDHGSQ